jgi:hypothetical protein
VAVTGEDEKALFSAVDRPMNFLAKSIKALLIVLSEPDTQALWIGNHTSASCK